MNNMADIYSGSDYNITTVFKAPYVADPSAVDIGDPLYDDGSGSVNYNLYVVNLQRLPVEQYPDPTEVIIYFSEISKDATKDEFISAALPIVNTNLAAYDAAFTGDAFAQTSTSSFTVAFE